MLRVCGTILAGFLGVTLGALLNVCLSRWPAKRLVRTQVGQPADLAPVWRDFAPVEQLYFAHSRVRFGTRFPLVELTMGALFAITAWRSFGAVPFFSLEQALGMMLFYCIAVGLAVVNAEHSWVPDVITVPATLVGVGWFVLLSVQGGLIFGETPTPWHDGVLRLVGSLAAAGLVLFLRWLYCMFRGEDAIALSDAKVMAVLGAWLGFPGSLLAFSIGVLLGALAALFVIFSPELRNRPLRPTFSPLPLGTFLCMGGILSGLFGEQIVGVYRWYTGF